MVSGLHLRLDENAGWVKRKANGRSTRVKNLISPNKVAGLLIPGEISADRLKRNGKTLS